MKKIYLSIIFLSILFVGCGTKREYFEPKEVAGDIIYNGSLPDDIESVSRYGATLENRQFISEDGLQEITLDEGYSYYGEFNGKYIALNNSGGLQVLNNDGTKSFEITFDQAVASASVNDNILAVVDSSNKIYLVRMAENEIYFQKKQDKTFALDTRIAAPYFLNTLAIFPTLDGKLIITDWKQGALVRSVVISSEPFFNNVIYLNVKQNRLIAATASRAISIKSDGTAFLDEKIKDIIATDDNIICLTNDGRIMILDLDLKLQREHKFLFAAFVSAMNDGQLYTVERNGHLITTDLNFEDIKVYNLPDEIESPVFMSNDTIYYNGKLTKLHED